jgi:hypothetical protein
MKPTQVINQTEFNINALFFWVISSVEGHSFECDDLEATWWQNFEFLKTVVWFEPQHADSVSLRGSIGEIDCVAWAMHVE